MYEKFYNLKQNPFSLTPDPAFVCMTGQHREALSGLIYSVCARSGLTLLVGEVGTGKTTLLYTMLEFLEKRQYRTAFCSNPLLNGGEFYDYLLSTLEVPCASSLKSQQWIALKETLLRNQAAGKPSVLIVDEAQKLSVELLEEIRLLTNLETPRQKLLQIIMAGQPELAIVFRRPELRQLKQRINYFCRLQALTMEELVEYVQHRLGCAGLPNQTLFPRAVLGAIYGLTKGIPRLVNALCDNALQNAFAIRSPQVTISIVEEAACDLDLLPVPPERHQVPAEEESAPRIASIPPSKSLTRAPGVLVPDFRPESDIASARTLGSRLAQPVRIPLESYVARQKSLGFLASLLDLW